MGAADLFRTQNRPFPYPPGLAQGVSIQDNFPRVYRPRQRYRGVETIYAFTPLAGTDVTFARGGDDPGDSV